MSGSIRQRAEEAKQRHTKWSNAFDSPAYCGRCREPWPCVEWVAADDTITDLNNLRAKRSNLPVAFAVQLIDPDPLPAASGSGGAQTTPNTA